MSDVPTIDTHLHIWRTSEPGMEWLATPHWQAICRDFPAEVVHQTLRAAGVSAGIVVQAATAASHSDELLREAASHSWIHGVVAWAPISNVQKLEERLDDLLGRGPLVGIRCLAGWAPEPDVLESRERLLNAARALSERDLVLEVQTDKCLQLAAMAEVAAAVPEVRLVIDHLGRPPYGSGEIDPEWVDGMESLAAKPNTVVKMSGVTLGASPVAKAELDRYASILLDMFGGSRVMFGGNWPVTSVGMSYQTMLDTIRWLLRRLDRADEAKVLGGTALQVYARR